MFPTGSQYCTVLSGIDREGGTPLTYTPEARLILIVDYVCHTSLAERNPTKTNTPKMIACSVEMEETHEILN